VCACMTTVSVAIPAEALELAGFPGQAASGAARQLIALELFREGRVSLGRAAELAGMSVEDFMQLAGERRVPLHYTEADWREDRETAPRLGL